MIKTSEYRSRSPIIAINTQQPKTEEIDYFSNNKMNQAYVKDDRKSMHKYKVSQNFRRAFTYVYSQAQKAQRTRKVILIICIVILICRHLLLKELASHGVVIQSEQINNAVLNRSNNGIEQQSNGIEGAPDGESLELERLTHQNVAYPQQLNEMHQQMQKLIKQNAKQNEDLRESLIQYQRQMLNQQKIQKFKNWCVIEFLLNDVVAYLCYAFTAYETFFFIQGLFKRIYYFMLNFSKPKSQSISIVNSFMNKGKLQNSHFIIKNE